MADRYTYFCMTRSIDKLEVENSARPGLISITVTEASVRGRVDLDREKARDMARKILELVNAAE